MIDWMIDSFKKDTSIDVSTQPMVLQRLKDAAEKTKIELSTSQNSEVNLPFLTADASGPKHFVQSLSRSQFERMIDPVIERTLALGRPAKRLVRVTLAAAAEPGELQRDGKVVGHLTSVSKRRGLALIKYKQVGPFERDGVRIEVVAED